MSSKLKNHVLNFALPDGAIGTNRIADDAITAAKIAAGAVGTSELADDSVTAAKIAADAVGTSEIAAGAVGASELASNAVTMAKLDVSVMAESDVTIAAAAVLTLFDTPVQLVAAPGAGSVIEPISYQFFLDYGTVAYTVGAGDDLQVKYANAAGAAASQTLETTGFLTATADAYRFLWPANSTTPQDNQPLVLHCLNANPGGGGNSPVKVRTRYRVRATSW